MFRLAFAVAILAASIVTTAAADGYRVPRTASGAPDLGGLWLSGSLTPMQRPAAFKTLVIPDDKAEAYEREANDPRRAEAEFKKAFPKAPDVGGFYTEGEGIYARLARIGGQARTSWLIDPPDGKLPLLPATRALLKAKRLMELRNFDSFETRPLAERCLVGFGATTPLMNTDDLPMLFVQTPDDLVIVAEANHDVRVIRLNTKAHAPPGVYAWAGDSIGWWEGDTLVVETLGFHPLEQDQHAGYGRLPISTEAKVTERFSRTSASEILYRFTVDDPRNYAGPWSGVMPLTPSKAPMYEYACHEGNYALAGILAGARNVERGGGVPEPLDGGDDPVVASSAPAPVASPPPASPPAP